MFLILNKEIFSLKRTNCSIAILKQVANFILYGKRLSDRNLVTSFHQSEDQRLSTHICPEAEVSSKLLNQHDGSYKLGNTIRDRSNHITRSMAYMRRTLKNADHVKFVYFIALSKVAAALILKGQRYLLNEECLIRMYHLHALGSVMFVVSPVVFPMNYPVHSSCSTTI